MLEKVIKNWTSRLDYIRASRDSHMPEIIFKMRQGCIWWPAEQKICRQTKITSKEHLGWGIAGGVVNGTPLGKQENGQFLVPVLLITGYQEREVVVTLSTMPSD
ncbi:hypothetical protein TNCV_1746951 [Trichonephila clavipes]|nr:hypothetical protein TNCV_1746951 [Trichonephila clavipes]